MLPRRGYDWTDRYPGIASVAAKLRAMSLDAFDMLESPQFLPPTQLPRPGRL